MKTYYICGYHRGGTHAYAEYLAQKNNYAYLDEKIIRWNDLENAVLISNGKIKKYNLENKTDKIFDFKLNNKDGIVLQCPGLSHKTIELSKHGKVIWVYRDFTTTIAAMKQANIGIMAWDLMKDFKNEFPEDEIWKRLKYNSNDDFHCQFVGYYTIYLKTKEYFCNKYFKGKCKEIKIEEQPFFNSGKFKSGIHNLKKRHIDKINEHLEIWDNIWKY